MSETSGLEQDWQFQNLCRIADFVEQNFGRHREVLVHDTKYFKHPPAVSSLNTTRYAVRAPVSDPVVEDLMAQGHDSGRTHHPQPFERPARAGQEGQTRRIKCHVP